MRNVFEFMLRLKRKTVAIIRTAVSIIRTSVAIPLYFVSAKSAFMRLFALALLGISSCNYLGDYELSRLDSLEIQLKAKRQSQQDSVSRLLEITGGRELPTDEQLVIPEGAIQGDFDGDSYSEYLYLEQPSPDKIEAEICTTVLKSNAALTDMVFNSCRSSILNIGDVDDDGTDEIQLVTTGTNGTWLSVGLLAYVNGKWKHCIDPFMINNAAHSMKQYIEKIGQGKVKIYYHDVSENTDFEHPLSKTVRVVK